MLSHDGSPYGASDAGVTARMGISQRFFAAHQDAYDFLIVFPAFVSDLEHEALGLHTPVHNDVSGTGKPIFDRSSDFGSATGRLRAYVDVGSLVSGNASSSVDTALGVIAHEVAHSWSGQVRFRDPVTGAISSDLLGRDGGHWSFFLGSNASVLYGSNWQDNGNGTFTSIEARRRYSNLDLYLMGLLAPAEVQDFLLLRPAPAVPFASVDLPPPDGTTVAASARTIRIGDVIAAEGPRVPDVTAAPSAFRAAFVLLLGPGQQATDEHLAFVDQVRKAWANQFFFLTRGRAVMETDLVEPAAQPVSSNPSAQAALDYLLAHQQADGTWADSVETRFRDTQAAVAALAIGPADARIAPALSGATAGLTGAVPSSADDAARSILAFEAISALPPDLGATLLPAFANPDSGYGLVPGYRSDVLDSALVGSARLAARAPASALDGLTSFLLAQQNADFGWPYAAGGPSRIEPTVRVLEYLRRLPPTAATSTAAFRGIGFLRTRQGPPGVFREEEVASASATALSALTMSAWNQLDPPTAQSVANTLLGTQLPDGSWSESAFQTGQAFRLLRTALVPNLAITSADVALSTSIATAGERAQPSVTVHNVGLGLAGPTTVRAYDSSGRAMGSAALPSLAGLEAATILLAIDTTGHAPSSEIFVVVDPDGTVDESRKDDNRAAAPFSIVPPPPGPELVAESISVVPGTVQQLPVALRVSARISNAGLGSASAVPVALLVRGVSVGTQSVAIASGGSAVVEFVTAVSSAGLLPVAVVVDPDNQIAGDRKENNTVSTLVPVIPVKDLRVAGLTVAPNPVDQGRDATVAFDVVNSGTVELFPADYQIVVRVTDPGSGTDLALLPVGSDAIPPGASLHRTALWRAATSGTRTISASTRLSAVLDPTPSDDLATTSLVVNPSTLPNLTFGIGAIAVQPSPPQVGKVATVTATVTNAGGAATGPFALDLYLGDPAAGGQKLARQAVSGLASGGSGQVVGSFSPQAAAAVTLVAIADPDAQVAEFDETDNTAALTVTPAAIPDLALAPGDVRPSVLFARPGQVVQVTVTVHNEGGQPSEPAPLQLFLGAPESGGRLVGESRVGAIDAGGSVDIGFSWPTVGLSGAQTLVAVVNGDHSALESRSDNNRAERTVMLQSGAVALSEPFFSPNGDGVKDTTEIFFQAKGTGAVVASVSDRDGKPVRSLPAADSAGSVVWDGRDDAGAVRPDGQYRIAVFQGSTLIGAATAVVDDNRSPLYEAARLKLLQTADIIPPVDHTFNNFHVTLFPTLSMPDDSGILRFGNSSELPFAPDRCFFDLYPLDGSGPTRLTPDNWTSDPSSVAPCPTAERNVFAGPDRPHGELRLLITPQPEIVFGVPINDGRFEELWVYTPSTQSFRHLSTGLLVPYESPAVLSPDGSTLVTVAAQLPAGADLVRIDIASGSSQTILKSGTPSSVAWSPDGSLLAIDTFGDFDFGAHPEVIGVHVLAPDGSALRPVASNSVFNGTELVWLPDGRHLLYQHAFFQDFVRVGDVVTGEDRSVAIQTTFDTTNLFTPMFPVPDGRAFLIAQNLGDVSAYFLDGSARATLFQATGLSIWAYGSAQGTFAVAHYSEPIGKPFPNELIRDHVVAITSAANLTARFHATRSVGETQLTFTGTAADLNFQDYDISARPLGSNAPPVVIARGASQVVNGVLARWTPPGRGLYEATLTSRDKAGNSRTARLKVAYTDQPAIANLAADPGHLSPNGDGVQDSTTLRYTVATPVTTEIDIQDPAGHVVRRIPRTHLQTGDFSADWDGRDDSGAVVPDGDYGVRAEGSGTLAVVDTRPPSLAFGWCENLQPTTGQCLDQSLDVQLLNAIAVGPDGSHVSVVQPWVRTSLLVSDAHLSGWTIEQGTSAGGNDFTPLLSGNGLQDGLQHQPFELVSSVRGSFRRARARDAAGNESVTLASTLRSEFFIVAAGDARPLQDPANGSLLLEGRTFPRIDLLTAMPAPGAQSKIDYPTYPFAIATAFTGAADIVSYAVQYHPQGAALPVTAPVHDLGGGVIVWDATDAPRYLSALSVLATDSSGHEFRATLGFAPLNVQLASCVALDPDALSPAEVPTLHVQFEWPGDEQVSGQVQLLRPDGSVAVTSTAALLHDDGKGHRFAAVPVAGLDACTYHAHFDGLASGGIPLVGDTDADVCGALAKGTSVDGDAATLRFAETFPGAVGSLDVYLRAADGGWARMGTVGSFDGETVATLPIPDPQLCGSRDVRLAARLADGTVIDSVTSRAGGPFACNLVLEVPCTTVSIGRVTRDAAGALCSRHEAVWTIPVAATARRPGTQVVGLAVSTLLDRGAVVGTLPVLPFAPSPSVATALRFESALHTEGTYYLGARATDSRGGAAQTGAFSTAGNVTHPGRTTPRVVVDRTLPQVGISSPAAAAHVCPVPTRRPDGTSASSVDVSGFVSDEHLEDYSVFLRPLGGSFEKFPGEAIQARTAVSGRLARIDMSARGPGDYELMLAASDISGSSSCSPIVPFHLDGAIQISGLQADPDLFSPDGDGQSDRTVLSFSSEQGGALTLKVRPAPAASDGVLVQQSVAAGAFVYSWDGSVPGAGRLDEGAYDIQATMIDACGNQATDSIPIRIDLTVPVARIDRPAPGDIVGAGAVILGEASDTNLDSYMVELGAGAAPSTYAVIATGSQSISGVLGSLDASVLAPGPYTLRLTAKDRAAHQFVAQVSFTVGARSLIQALTVVPAFVSPGTAGAVQTATAALTLRAAATASLTLVNASGAPVATVLPPQLLAAGTSTVTLGADVLAGASEGAYSVRASASAAGSEEVAEAPLQVDRTAPAISVVSPAEGSSVSGSTDVIATISDPALASWSVTLDDGTVEAPLASGTASLANNTLARLRRLKDGAYSLHFVARDAAGNRRESRVAFRSDSTPPVPSFVAPRDGAVLSGASGPVSIVAAVQEADLASVSLEVVRGGSARLLFSGPFPAGGVLASWDVAAEGFGSASLRLTALDRAGNSGAAEISVVLDSMPPTAVFDPLPTVVTQAPLAITGIAIDPNLASYVVDLAPGPQATPGNFSVLASGTSSFLGGTLATIAVLPPDGPYTVRLTAIDKAGNRSSTTAGFTVRTTVPPAPTDLVASIENRRDVRLSWSAVPAAASYRVLRAVDSSQPAMIAEGVGPSPSFVDLARPDGAYRYQVVSVDEVGLSSLASAPASLVIRANVPTARIRSPVAGAVLGGSVQFLGAASSNSDFREYRLSIGAGSQPSSYTLLARSAVPVTEGLLGAIDLSSYPQGSVQTVRLETEDLFGNVGVATVSIQIDDEAPSAPVLRSAFATGSDVTVTWTASPEPDVAGYLVFRDGLVANADPAQALADLSRYLLPPGTTSFVDRSLPDGTYTYQLQAMDRAGNSSPLSNALSTSLDQRAPAAVIVAPQALARLEGPTEISAIVVDQDVASVQFQIRAGSATDFTDLGGPLVHVPWTVTLDPSQRGSAVLEVRAVARDKGGRADPQPQSAFVFFDPPLQPVAGRARVDGLDVAIDWTDPNPPGRVGAVQVWKGSNINADPIPERPPGTTSATSGSPLAAYDGSLSTSWSATGPVSWQVDFQSPTVLSGLRASLTVTATVAVFGRIDGVWVALAAPTRVSGDYVPQWPRPLRLEAVRLTFPDPTAAGLFEVVPSEVPTTSPGRLDASAQLGVNSYTIAALSAYGQRVDSGLSATVTQVQLDPLPDAVPDATVLVSGSGAEPGSSVQITDNAAPVAIAGADPSGHFGAPVSLQPGTNQIVAQATGPGGDRSIPSAPLLVFYDPPPSLSVSLSAIANGSTASLSISTAGDPSNVASLQLSRSRDGSAALVIAALDLAALSYTDAGLANGHYRYTIVAVNGHGFAGPSSAPAEIDVAVQPPAAPLNLTATSPSGLEVDLAWSASIGAAAHSIERAGPGSSFSVVAQVAGLAFADRAVEHDVTYTYRVRAVDAQGNRSLPSNEVAVTPRDATPPSTPEILRPTTAGNDLVTTVSSAMVVGTADPGDTVQLFRNTVFAGQTIVSLGALRVPIATAHVPQAFDVSTGGARIAYVYTTDAGGSGVAVEDRSGHVLANFVDPALQPSSVVISPDGSRLAVEAFSSVTSRQAIYAAAVTESQLRVLVPAATQFEGSPAWSPESGRIAYVTRDASNNSAIGIAGFTDGVQTLISVDSTVTYSSVAWAMQGVLATAFPKNLRLLKTLVRIDPATGSRTTLLSARFLNGRLRLSPARDRVALTTSDGIREQVVVVDPGSLATTSPKDTGSVHGALAFSSDGSLLLYLADGEALQAELGSGTIVDLGAVTAASETSGASFFWNGTERILFTSSTGANSISFGGQFEIDDVALEAGGNVLFAVATSPGGRTSEPSAPIFIQYQPPGTPDLAVDARISPAVPIAGGPASAEITVRNLGTDLTATPSLRVTLIGSDGSLRDAPAALPGPLPSGAAETVSVPLDTRGLSGMQQLAVVVDPEQAVSDPDRRNNEQTVPFMVAANQGISVAIAVVPSVVGADQASTATISVANGGPVAGFSVRVRLLDGDGNEVMVLGDPEQYTAFPAQAVSSFTRTVPVGTTLAGTYKVVAETVSPTGNVASAAPLTILADRRTALTLETDRATYRSGQDIAFTSRVTNGSINAVLAGATWALSVSDATALRYSASSALPPLPRTGTAQAGAVISGGLPPGTYSASARVTLGDNQLASAVAAFEVRGVPQLVGALDLVPGATVPAGATLHARFTVSNVGTAAATGVVVRASAFDPDSFAVLASKEIPFTALAVGETALDELTVPTAGLPPKPYAVTVSAVHYDAISGEVLATAAFRVSDSGAPAIAVQNLRDGMVVRGLVSPQVRAIDDFSGVASVFVSVDGGAPAPLAIAAGTALQGTWSVILPLAPDGGHTLVFGAVDAEGNFAAPAVIHLISDSTAPQVSLSGVQDGALTNVPVTPVFSATDGNLSSVRATLNGADFVSGMTITDDGDYRLIVQATDGAANVAIVSVAFTIDRTPPVIFVTGVADGDMTPATVTPLVIVTDAHPGSFSISLDGVAFASGTVVSSDGTHVLVVNAQDRAGNPAQSTVHFTISRNPPQILLSGVTDGSIVNTDVTPVFSAGSATVAATLNGLAFTSGTIITAEGSYTLRITATDAAGVSSLLVVGFIIDKTPPAIALTGFVRGDVKRAVTPGYTVSDANPATDSATLDGFAFTGGTIVSAEGGHTFSVTATDLAGNSTSRSASLIIDRTDPVIVAGAGAVTDGAYLRTTTVNATFTESDANPGPVVCTLDGLTITCGIVTADEGPHNLVVVATDLAGNQSTRTIGFVIDLTAPVVSLTAVTNTGVAVTNGAVVNASSVAVSYSVGDSNPGTVTATLDGSSFASGTAVSSEADHSASVTATDKAGNSGAAALAFAIDRTPPAIAIAGVTEGATYNAPVTPRITVSDAHPGTTSVQLDGQPYTSGTAIGTSGAHTLTASATDAAGNSSQSTVHFTITFLFQIAKSLPVKPPLRLALLKAGQCALSSAELTRVTNFLRTYIGASVQETPTSLPVPVDLQIDSDETTFLGHLRSGRYNSFVWVDLTNTSASCAENNDATCTTAQCATRRSIAREMTELAYSGKAGVVLIRNRAEALPTMDELLGTDVNGAVTATGVTFNSSSPLGAQPDLTVASPLFSLKLLSGGASASTYKGVTSPKTGGPFTATVTRTLLQGKTVSFGYDLTKATSASSAGNVLLAAVNAVTPTAPALKPLAVTLVRIDVSRDSSVGNYDVQERVSRSVVFVARLPQPPLGCADPKVNGYWQGGPTVAFPALQQAFLYLARVPDQIGTFPLLTRVGMTSTCSSPPVEDPNGVDATFGLSVAENGAGLMADANAAAAALPTTGNDGIVRTNIQQRLSAVSSRLVTTKADAESNLTDLLAAVDQAKTLTSDPTSIRLALGELIRYWEARWSIS